jgi:hypothetical protein
MIAQAVVRTRADVDIGSDAFARSMWSKKNLIPHRAMVLACD